MGDPKQIALLGIGYYRLEADFAPAMYIDSDLTDGVTNREGWAFHGTRQIFPNTELSLSLFLSDAIEEGAPVRHLGRGQRARPPAAPTWS